MQIIAIFLENSNTISAFFPLSNPVPGTTSPVQNVPYTFAHKGKNVREKINTHS